jgi:hypothetical protein
MSESANGYLIVSSADGAEVYGEFPNPRWEKEESGAGVNHIFSGLASDGTIDTFRKLDADGIEHVTYRYEGDGRTLWGNAILLRPETHHDPLEHWVRIETAGNKVNE